MRLMDFYIENWDEASPIDSIIRDVTIATLYKLQAMADGPKLPACTSLRADSIDLFSARF